MPNEIHRYADVVLEDIEDLDQPIGMLEAVERLLDYADLIATDEPNVADSARTEARDLLREAKDRAEQAIRFARDVANMAETRQEEE